VGNIIVKLQPTFAFKSNSNKYTYDNEVQFIHGDLVNGRASCKISCDFIGKHSVFGWLQGRGTASSGWNKLVDWI
jgi:hypothetical protein